MRLNREKSGMLPFQYMLLLRGAKTSRRKRLRHKMSFNTCSSCEEQSAEEVKAFVEKFQYMLLLRGAMPRLSRGLITMSFNTCSSCEEQHVLHRENNRERVSIHAPLARSNFSRRISSISFSFQYMLLLRGATRPLVHKHARLQFQYMLLLRGATPLLLPRFQAPEVSIHAPLARSNRLNSIWESLENVSIHAPLARSNGLPPPVPPPRKSFNTCSSCEEQPAVRYATYSSRAGFNTCSSCEEQRLSGSDIRERRRFNTCSSCEEQLPRIF